MGKVKKFFAKFFKKKEEKVDDITQKNTIQYTTNEDFIRKLKAQYSSSEEIKNQQLFNLFKNGKIKEEDLTEEEKEIISKLYIRDIKKEVSTINKLLKKVKK